jgi:signal peptidase II
MIWFIAFLSGLLLVLADQLVKYLARVRLMPLGSIDIIEGFFSLTYLENDGAAFGLLQGWRWVFIPLTVIVVVFILIYYARLPRTRLYWAIRVPLIFILAGALGNFIDRLRFGYVVDMFEFRFITFPVFNVADVCLVLGTAAFVIVSLFVIKDEPKNG